MLTPILLCCWLSMNGQTYTLLINNNINSTSSLAFTAATAGINPSNLNLFNTNSGVNNTAQVAKYSWKFYGTNPDDSTTYTRGKLTVKTNVALPSGLQWTVAATAPPNSWNGTTTGVQIIGTTTKTLITGILHTSSNFWLGLLFGQYSTLSNTLTQVLSITNFADLHPITYTNNSLTVTLTYEMSNM